MIDRSGMQSAILLSALFAATAFGQSTPEPTSDRVIALVHASSQQAVSEVANVISGIALTSQASPGPAEKTITLTGTASQLAAAEWLVHQLDLAGSSPAPARFSAPGGDSVTVLYAQNVGPGPGLSEILNAVRMISELQRAMPVASIRAVVARGAPEQVDLLDWAFHALDIAGPGTATASYPKAAPEAPASAGRTRPATPAVRVFFAPNAANGQAFAEMMNACRSVSGTQMMLPVTGVKALVLRGTAEQADLVEWLVRTLDKPADWAPATPFSLDSRELSTQPGDRTGSSVRVFYFSPSMPQQELANTMNAVRTAAGLQVVMPVSARRALVLRGNPAQVSTAEQAARQRAESR